MGRKNIWWLSASLLAMLAAPAGAQEAAGTAEAEDTGEIVVTARRVNETLSDVPASITAFDAEAITRTGVQNASDFAQLTPGVTIVSSTAEAGDTQINIRGINGARDAESSVALVVDGILKTNTAALDQNQGTLRQVEILKGPQGALYGRNAAAGAIVIQTLKPGDSYQAGIRASYANNNTIDADAYVSTPIGDGIGILVSGNYFKTDGFFRNEFLPDRKTVDDRESWNINGRLVAEFGEATTVDAKVRYGELSGASIAFNASFHLPNFAAVNPAFYEDVNDHRFRFYTNIRPTNRQETFEASIKLDHDFGPATLSAWALYSDIRNDLTADGTSADFARYISAANPAAQSTVNACFASTAALTGFPLNPPTFIGQIPVPFIFAPANGSTFGPYSPTTCDGTQYQVRNQRDISTEIRLVSNGDERLDWQLGLYYLNISRKVGVSLGGDTGAGIIRNLYNPPNSTNPTSQLFADRFKTDVYAAFGAVDFEATDSIDLSIALRYDIERRRVRNLVPTATDPFTGGPINPGQAFGPIAPQQATFKELQPKITARWEIAPDTNLFANWGVGFKSGGFNNQGSAAIVNANFNQFLNLNPPVLITDRFRKERSSAFEAGIKGRFGAINYSLAGYYTQVDDMQFFEFFVGSFGLLRVVSNIDRVDLKGAELNVNVDLVRGWNLYGALNVTDSKIKRNRSRPDTVGNESPYTADYTINLGSQWTIPVASSFDFVARADYRLTGPTWFHTVQNQEKPTLFSGLLPISPLGLPGFVGNARYDVNQRDTFGVLDVRVGLQGERWRVTAFANNLLNEKYLAEVIPAIEFGGSFISPGARRLYGLELGYRF
jgi:iron complex outermembrane recepter protein